MFVGDMIGIPWEVVNSSAEVEKREKRECRRERSSEELRQREDGEYIRFGEHTLGLMPRDNSVRMLMVGHGGVARGSL